MLYHCWRDHGRRCEPGGTVRLNEHFSMFVPTGRAFNPITKTNWEGTGIKPDVDVPAANALKTAHLLALKSLEAATSDQERKAYLTKVIQTLEKRP